RLEALHPGEHRRAPASLAGEDQVLPPLLAPADADRLELPPGKQALCKPVERLSVEDLAWLVRVAGEGLQLDRPGLAERLDAVVLARHALRRGASPGGGPG